MATRLTKMELDEISLVDAAANPKAKVVLYKRDPRGPVAPVLVPLLARIAKDYPLAAPLSFDDAVMARSIDAIHGELCEQLWALRDSLSSILQSDAADKGARLRASMAQFVTALDATIGDWFDDSAAVTKSGRTLTAEQRTALPLFRKTLAGLSAPPKEVPAMKKADKTKIAKHVLAALEELGLTEPTEDQVAKLEARLPKPGVAGTKADKATIAKSVLAALDELGITEPTEEQVATLTARLPVPEEKPEDVLKGLTPAARALVEKAQADAAAATKAAEEAGKVAKAEREQRVTKEFIAKAQTLAALPGMNADDFGVVLKGIAEKAPEAWAKLEPLLKSAHEAIRTGALFVEKGAGGEGSGAAAAQVDAKAKELVAKSATGLTLVQARVKVWESEPELYAAYRREQREEG